MTYLECLEWMNVNTDSIAKTFIVNGTDEVSIHYWGVLIPKDFQFSTQYCFNKGEYYIVTSKTQNNSNLRTVTITGIEAPSIFEPDDVWFNFTIQYNIGKKELMLYQRIQRYLI